MEVFRIASDKYTRQLNASGKSSRWNKDNQFVIYAAQSRSLSALELVVHKNIQTALKYEVMIISIADVETLYTRLPIKGMPKNWREYKSYAHLQDIGSDWYVNKKSLVLQVPSVIIPQEFNYVINLNHPDFSAETVSLVRTEAYFWDERLPV